MKKICQVEPPFSFDEYTRVISRLAEKDGGGFLITFPDLPGCISDGDTEEEALENGKDAFLAWISARMDQGKRIPEPKVRPVDYVAADVSGRFLARLPKYIHARLVKRAQREGVSVNALVLSFIASGLGQN
jgi:predicted RNase H-like HicB family nuclease